MSWLQKGLDIDGEAVNDESGTSVSISSDGNTVAIGAVANNGQVRVYKYISSTWTQLGADIDGEASGDYSGFSVSISSDGSTVAIGARRNDGNGSNSGHVRVYKYIYISSTWTWTQLGVDIDGEYAFDESGYSVSISSDGSTVAIGANKNDGNGSNSGHVRVYKYDGATWNKLGADIDGESSLDESGWSVSISSDGSTVAIGARMNDGNGSNSGHVRVYKYDGATWNQLGADIDGETANDLSGYSVSISSDGSTVAIGASLNADNGSNSGHVRVYKYISSTWTQLGTDINGEAAFDESGESVSISGDGSTVAIGATYNSGNGADSGHVRVYKYDGSTWVQLGTDINGEAAGDYSGASVSISDNGSTVAIGAPFNGNRGHVRVYEFPLTNPICFQKDTPVTTSKGIKLIQHITKQDTINGISVHSLVTSLIPKNEQYFVKISKDSLGYNIPSQDTICTIYHTIRVNLKKNLKLVVAQNVWVQAIFLVNNINITLFSEPKDTLVYNVLLVDNIWGTMIVNNLLTETLHPDNNVAKSYYNSKKKQIINNKDANKEMLTC
jgi:hypothetical protein